MPHGQLMRVFVKAPGDRVGEGPSTSLPRLGGGWGGQMDTRQDKTDIQEEVSTEEAPEKGHGRLACNKARSMVADRCPCTCLLGWIFGRKT